MSGQQPHPGLWGEDWRSSTCVMTRVLALQWPLWKSAPPSSAVGLGCWTSWSPACIPGFLKHLGAGSDERHETVLWIWFPLRWSFWEWKIKTSKAGRSQCHPAYRHPYHSSFQPPKRCFHLILHTICCQTIALFDFLSFHVQEMCCEIPTSLPLRSEEADVWPLFHVDSPGAQERPQGGLDLCWSRSSIIFSWGEKPITVSYD
jgi:hypothetical protein